MEIPLQQELVAAGLRLRKVIARVVNEAPETLTNAKGKWSVEFRNPISGEFLAVTYSRPTKPVNPEQQN
jgi:hypothetical protein